MIDPRILARRIVAILQSSKISVSTEVAAHNDVSSALSAAGLAVTREVALSPRDRIDVLVENVGVEVKVQGSRRDIYRQLERYAASDRIEAMVLASSSAWPTGITVICGKPFFHASLVKGWL